MKKAILFSLFLMTCITMSAQKISYINESGGYYVVYNESNSKMFAVSDGQGELVGYSDNYYILQQGGYYKIYNAKNQKVCTVSVQAIGEIVRVNSNNFVARKSGWTITYDMNARAISKR